MAEASGAGMQVESTGRVAGARIIALLVLAGGVALSVFSLVVALSTYGRPESYAQNPLGEFGAFGVSVTLLALGYVLRTRRPGNRIGTIFLAFGVVATVTVLAWTAMLVSVLPSGDRQLGAYSSLLGATLGTTAWSYLIGSLILRFPHGDASSAVDARLLRLLLPLCAVAGVTTVLRPGTVLIIPAFDNPIATPAGLHPFLVAASNAALLAILAWNVAAAYAMFRRYRRASVVERLQLRWFAFGAGILLAASILYIVAGVLVAPTDKAVRELTYAIFVVSLISLPIAVFQAITSHSLYDIDRIIGRTVAYGALTAILAGVYAASVRLFNWLFVETTGETSEVALVLTTLVLATTFTPIKSRLEKVAARRFPAGKPETEAVATTASLDPSELAALEARLDARIDDAVRRALDAQAPSAHQERPRRR